MSMEVSHKNLFQTDYEQITTTDVAIGFDSVKASGVDAVLIRVDVAGIRWRADGINPTTTVGMPLKADDDIWLDGNDAILKFRLIDYNGHITAEVNVSFFKYRNPG